MILGAGEEVEEVYGNKPEKMIFSVIVVVTFGENFEDELLCFEEIQFC